LSLHNEGDWPLPYRALRVVLPPDERRPLERASFADVPLSV